MQWRSEHQTGQPRCFSEHRPAHAPRQSGGSSNDFSGRLVPLQPRSINILWGDPGWCMHTNRTLHRHESLPGASCHYVHGLSPSLHISNRAAITVSCADTTVRQHAPCADEETHHVSGLGPVQLVLNINQRGLHGADQGMYEKRAQFQNFFPSFFWVCCADSFLIILAEANANTWNSIKSLLQWNQNTIMPSLVMTAHCQMRTYNVLFQMYTFTGQNNYLVTVCIAFA